MFTTIINDCKDDNARGRQECRVASLALGHVSFVGVESDLEAGMQLIDMLDATEGRKGLILVNVAPRGGHTRQWENGTPFGYFWYHETLVVASVDGFVLSAVKDLGLLSEVALLDTHTGSAAMAEAGFITPEAAARIPGTQFRSFDFIPRAGLFLLAGTTLPSTALPLESVPALPPAIWHIDNFGNCKTTLRPEAFAPNTVTRYATLPFIKQLKDVPDATGALTVGSSGIHDTRFVEAVIQRGNFARTHEAHIGDDLFTTTSHFRKATS